MAKVTTRSIPFVLLIGVPPCQVGTVDSVWCLVPQSQSSLAFGATIPVVGYCNLARFWDSYSAIVRVCPTRSETVEEKAVRRNGGAHASAGA
jgi:hypothetical protein